MFSTCLRSNPLRKCVKSAGFGLIELMVSITIMAVIMAVVLARHDAFNGAVLLRSQAYQVALQLREIQLSAVSAVGVEGEYRSVVGAYFTTANPNKYQIFQDGNGNNSYDAGEEFGQQGIIDPRFRINAIRRGVGSTNGSPVSVVFERPDFDARFFGPLGGYPDAVIEIDIVKVDDPSVVRTIEITATGQIAVK